MSLIFQFAGQGSLNSKTCKTFVDFIDHDLFKKASMITRIDLKRIILEGTDEELKMTEITQPLMFTICAIIYTILKMYGFKPKFVLGHSLGQFAAAFAAEVFSFEDGLELVYRRGQLMQKAVPLGVGGMVAVMSFKNPINEDEIIQICYKTGCNPANFNSPYQLVFSGKTEGIKKAIDLLKNTRYKTMVLPVSVAFHCPLLEVIVEEFRKFISEKKFNNAKIPIVSNVTGRCLVNAKDIENDFISHITSPVLWSESNKNIITLNGNNPITIVEIGNSKPILMRFFEDTAPKVNSCQKFVIHNQATLKEFLQKR